MDPMPVSPPSSPTTDSPGILKMVFDWDDTLLPTTQLADNYADTITGVARLPAAVTDELVALQQAAVKLLVEAVTIADVTIVTNARPGWIDHSGRTFVPGLLETLQKFGVHVVYAREAHDEEEVDPDAWKMSAFCNLVETAGVPPNQVHLVSIGDSVFERNAAHFAARQFSIASIKTVKLIDPWEGPTVDQLRRQLEVLTDNLRQTCSQDCSLNLEMKFSHGLEGADPQLSHCSI